LAVVSAKLSGKLQHWSGFPAKNGRKAAPVLEFVLLLRLPVKLR